MIAQVHFISSPNKTLCNVNTEGAAAALLATPQIVYKQRADVERLPKDNRIGHEILTLFFLSFTFK